MRRILLAGDVVALLLSLAVAAAIFALVGRSGAVGPEALAALLAIPVWLALAYVVGLYHTSDRHVDHSLVDEVGPAFLVASVWIWAATLIAGRLTEGPTQLLWLALAWLGGCLLPLLVRAALRGWIRRTRWYRQGVLILGDEDGIERLMRRIERHPEYGLDPIARISASNGSFVLTPLRGAEANGSSLGLLDGERRSLEGPEEICELAVRVGIQRVLISGWSQDLDERTALIRTLAASRLYVDLVSGEPEALLSDASVHYLEGVPVMTVRPRLIARVPRAIKRSLDLGVAILGLLALAPLLAFAAVRIKLDSPGPILFRQRRAGREGGTFEMLKFRTMVDGADAQREELRAANADGDLLKLRDDPRITRVGRWLRRTSIDELPQLWNVLRGEMSLVGPRPLPLDEVPLIRGHFADRHRVRPGITGPWQVHGRSDIPFEDMVKLDYNYVLTWSMREDLRLLIRTVGAVFGGRGAY